MSDPIDQCVAASWANMKGAIGQPPTASLFEIVDAVRAHKDEPNKLRVVPDPRLIAAIVACRDYEAHPLVDGGVEPIVILRDATTGRAKALICVEYPEATRG